MSSVGSSSAKPFFLGLRESLAELGAILFHPRKDVVAGAVEDAGQAVNLIANQPATQGADDGDAAADAGFESEAHFLLGRGLKKAVSVGGEKGLVRGDHVLASGERGVDEAAGRLNAAHKFDHHVTAILDDLLRIRRDEIRIHARTGFLRITYEDFLDGEFDAGAVAQQLAVAVDQFN